MKITNVSETGITMSNFLPVSIKRGSIIEIIGSIKLRVADSDTLKLHLYSDCNYENSEHRGAAGSNGLSSWDGMNYAGFWYDVDSGNFSESLEVTNITGRTIPQGGLTYTSHRIQMLYPVTRIKGKKPHGTDGSYLTFKLGGNNYAVRSNGPAKILVGQGDCIYDKKTLQIGYNEFSGETWEMGEGYTLAAPSVNYSENPRKARIVLKRNGVVLDDVWLKEKEVYRYTPIEDNEMPKLITYLDACFAGSTFDMIQFRYTWLVSDNVTVIKVGDRFGVFNVTIMEPDRIVLTNMGPIDLKAGSGINLLGNLGFFVENSDELRFYPTNMVGINRVLDEVAMNNVSDIPDSIIPVMAIPAGNSPVTGGTENTPGFEAVMAITILLAVTIIGKKRR
jgi:S-layer protein (TIGR01567 family)